MTIEETIAAAVAAQVRLVVREELRAALAAAAPTEDCYLSIATAAAFAEVHPDTARAWVKAGLLPEHRAGRELRVRRSELVAFLRAGAQPARPSPEEEAISILGRRR